MLSASSSPTPDDKIAIIGIGCRLPGGATGPDAFWRNLAGGKDCITPTPRDRYDVTTLSSRNPGKAGRLVGGHGGYVDGVDEFDPAFFGISPREAEHMDPQQRKLLEVTWEALEDGGQRPADLAGQDVGVFVGAFTLDYKILQFGGLDFDALAAHTATGTMMTMVSNRLSHCFDFRGPSVSIDTACSSSLVAVHLARQSLLRGESSLALVGGTSLQLAPQYTISESKGGFLSPDGRSRTFDAAANGYVRAEGVAAVALKRLADAERDGDPIYALISGTGVNQDGRTNGITVPDGDRQVELIERVCAEAGIVPGDLQYVEAHGTSTAVGDPIEANALGRALSVGHRPGAVRYVGSVKTNIGHTEAAAGVTGLIKVALSLRHRRIPPHINLRTVHPEIDLASLPYRIPAELTDWPEHDGPARAGVNSFGFGGTNAHVLVEEAPPRAVVEDAAAVRTILPISARDEESLRRRAEAIRAELDRVPARDLGYTLARRRQHQAARLAVVHSSAAQLRDRLDSYLRGEARPGVVVDQRRDTGGLAWVFTGMGPQWWAMGRQLFDAEPVYRDAIEQCDAEIRTLAGWSLVDELRAAEPDSRMGETWLAQPANFAVQVGLAALWRHHGVRPDAVVGHSTGEIAAFHEAGVYSLRDAVAVAIHRSRLQHELTGTGTMLAVGLGEDEALRRIRVHGDRVSVAAVNGPATITLAGDEEVLRRLTGELAAEQIFARLLDVRVPYHSARMDLIKDELLASLSGIRPREAALPLYLTGMEAVAHGSELDAAYWWRNVRDSVRFRAAVDRLAADGYRGFLEIGPHPVLAHSIRECLAEREIEGTTLPSIRRGEDEQERFLTSLAALHARGADISWNRLHPAGEVVSLPPYPWKRDRYWAEPEAVAQIRLGLLDHRLLGRRMATAEPAWEARLDVERLPYLADHRIQGGVVLPAAAYAEMAAQAVRAMTGENSVVLADLELRKALFLADGDGGKVQLAFAAENATFTIATMTGDDRRSVHAAGAAAVGRGVRGLAPADFDALRGPERRHLSRDACYAALEARGYQYGPAFQAIEEVWVGEHEALARIGPPQQVTDAAEHHVHPVLLDACFQALLVPDVLRDAGDAGIRLPLSIAELRLDEIGAQPIWAHAVLTGTDGADLVGDIAVYAADGSPLGLISGFRAGDVDRAAATLSRGAIDDWLVEPSWPPLPVGEPVDARGRWLVFADRRGVAAELAARIAADGGTCHLVFPGVAHGGAAVVPGDPADLRRLLDELGGAPFDHVVHLWNLDAPTIDRLPRAEFEAHKDLGGFSLITLARVLQERRGEAQLHVVTRGAQAVVDADEVEPLGAPAWGIGRVLRQQESVRNRGKLIDLEPGRTDPAADAVAVLRAVAVPEEDEIAVRGDGFRAARLRPAQGLSDPLPLRLRADGSYLVTGAFGALGRLLCRTLVKRGARRLILVSRSGLPERAGWSEAGADGTTGRNIRFVRELEALGAQPVVARLDITDESSLVDWLAEHRRGAPQPIRGVFHLAGHLQDTLVSDMDKAAYDAVHDTKVVGAHLLHRHLSDEPVEHFVLFASIASLLTTAGQANYAAGNAFLDALAHHRRARGLPALSIDWGPWATGMIEEQGLVEHYRNSRGMSSLAPANGMAVLERIIGQRHAQLVVATIVDWPTFLSWYPVAPPLVADLAAAADLVPPAEDGGFLEAFRAADPRLRRGLLAEHFTALVANVLRVPPESIAEDDGLSALGLDSMLAMELRARIHTELGVALPVVALLGNTPVHELVDQVHDEVLDAADDAGGGAVVEVFRDEHRYPLTQNQKALWFLKQLHPDGFAYNIGGAVEVRAELDPRLLSEAFATLVARHPILRASFVLDGGEPVQRIAPEAAPDFAVFDVRGLPWDEIHRRIVAEYRKPYDLERDPLIRFRLFQREPDRWVLVKAVHHIISDAISTFTFIEELLACYEGLRRGVPAELPPVPATYLDFLNRQNRFLAGPDAQRMLDYWRSHLPAQVPVLNLPTDKPRPLVQTHNGASEFFALDTALSTRVHELAREHGVTPFVVLLSAYYLLLHRYSGQDDIVVGSPVTGRTEQEFAGVYGYFVNPLPLHANLGADPSVAELLDQVRTTVLGGLDNQEYPFVLLVEQLGLQHDPSRSAVFQVMFILLHHKVSAEQYGYHLDYVELPEEEGQFDITLSVYEDEADHRFHCVFKYNTDLFLPETMRRLAGHYTALLDALTGSPGTRRVGELPMLAAAERDRILGSWSGPRHETVPGAAVHELIAAVAADRPDAIAVTAPAEDGTVRRLTYGELDEWSRRLARGLRARGVRDGAIVALCLDKSPLLIAAVLAVLRAGGAYLPLDREQPAERLGYMARHAGASLVVADEAGRDHLGALDHVVTPAELDARPDGDADRVAVAPEAPAYVCFTSGSTGRPKAVQVSHRNLASAYAAWHREYGLGDDVRVHLQLANFAFDVFTGDLVRALCSGGTLVLVGRELLFNTARLHRTMLAEQVDCAEFVPAVVRGLVEHCESSGARLDFMRLLVVGSDTWKVEEYRRLRELCGPRTRVLNSYGVTEATIDSSCFEGPVDGLEPSASVPIGTPLPNSRCYILDDRGRPVPQGVVGELWIGGDGVATGYRGDPEQTEQRFRTITPHDEPVRCYRTGDLAKWDARGVVHLLGRADTQVKVRGHRIEIGEVESQLARWPQLKQVVVVAHEDSGGDTALCAYCVPAAGAVLDQRKLRGHLAEHLPTFMIPAHFVELPALPLTVSGKIDVESLPAPEAGRSRRDHEPTVTLFETRMAEHWKSLLDLDEVGLQDDFFELGGSSIKLIELIHHVQREFDITVAVGELFKTTTLRGMAKTVEHVITGRLPGSQPYVRFNEGRGEPVCCFPPVGGHGLVYRQLAGRLPEHELLGFNHLSGADKVERYADLVEQVRPDGPRALLGYSLGGNLAFEVAAELERRGRAVSRVVIVDSYRITEPFEVGPERLDVFERELAEHLRKHTGTEVVAAETREQAREYLEFCGRTPNRAVLDAPISVLSDPANIGVHLAGEEGSWQDRSRGGTAVLRGSGAHADMLDGEHAGANADLVRSILAGGAADDVA
ncbi:amino acid adenylation domain-containing protein [Saccharopolyspora sp. NFXS83]|uniref:non-ribosomal peptide synthetase/type I polyketide synthase n=1 Tax=Saccharopolyspora sp. NFXS83 TaxID=2993560 RepID=UPI00224A6555|nr:non-ribosomal peptide synthetase/type I polyketide synthase [Saccharopolyspora sp. NFXS83]MCX2729531.1 amino acid adenylation domain-containing protein [Saccharopolyspora sp. NFXS83]